MDTVIVGTFTLHKNIVGGKRKDLIEPFLFDFSDLRLTVGVEVTHISGDTATIEITRTTHGYISTKNKNYILESVETYLYEQHL